MELVKPFDTWRFKGAKTTYGTLAAVAAAAASPTTINDKAVTDLGATAHGLLAGSLIYIQGTTNYDGLKSIQAVDTNDFTIYNPFTAETTTTADTWKTMYSSPHPFDFLGFHLHLDAASATSENITVDKDANAGTEFDLNLYTLDMDTVQDISQIYDEPIPCEGGDKIDIAWDNTNTKTWGISIFTRRR